MLAQALAGEFGSPVRAADELRLYLRRAELDPADRAIFLPPTRQAPRPALLLSPKVAGWQRERYIALAVAHHVLRHRALEAYHYGPDGPLFDALEDATEAEQFADVFLRTAAAYGTTATPRLRVLDSRAR